MPATSVDRQCGSSQQAVHFVAQGVIAGAYDIGDRVRRRVDDAARRCRRTRAAASARSAASSSRNTNNTLGIQFWVAQVLADKWGITREEMDAYALQSHQRAAANTDNGFFPGEIVPVPIKDETAAHRQHVDADEGIRRDASLEKIAGARPPAWESDDQPAPDITAGNSSQMTDGAAAMLIAIGRLRRAARAPGAGALHALRGRGRRSGARARRRRCPSRYKLMERTGMKLDEFDAVECNEAFAAIALMWQKEFDYPMERFNPRGGAIALGHPLGASGVALMTRLLRHLEATGGRYGFQTMCEGGGQANATVIERLS